MAEEEVSCHWASACCSMCSPSSRIPKDWGWTCPISFQLPWLGSQARQLWRPLSTLLCEESGFFLQLWISLFWSLGVEPDKFRRKVGRVPLRFGKYWRSCRVRVCHVAEASSFFLSPARWRQYCPPTRWRRSSPLLRRPSIWEQRCSWQLDTLLINSSSWRCAAWDKEDFFRLRTAQLGREL